MSDKKQPPLKVVPLHESNYRDIVAALRLVADQIESGEFGQVNDCAMAIRSCLAMAGRDDE